MLHLEIITPRNDFAGLTELGAINPTKTTKLNGTRVAGLQGEAECAEGTRDQGYGGRGVLPNVRHPGQGLPSAQEVASAPGLLAA